MIAPDEFQGERPSVVLPRLLVTFSGVDVPDQVQAEVMRLLGPYDPDIYERAMPANHTGGGHDARL